MDSILDGTLTGSGGRIRRRDICAGIGDGVLARSSASSQRSIAYPRRGRGRVAAARAADDAIARKDAVGPLHGVPLAHKDMFYRAGKPATCGAEIRRSHVAETDSTALRRLDNAGAIYVGGLNMSEFASNPTGHNDHFGHARNPWNPDHITGGSSSGSGAATAARLAFGALGSDTGGSVRLPATMCGVTGLKPTYGRVSRFGAMPLSWSMDHVGRWPGTAEDCALMMAIIAGEDPLDPTSSRRPVPDYRAALNSGLTGVRIGVPTSWFGDGVVAEVAAATRPRWAS
jgi:aspartyl-tRNA(Asn)/glutamyl-tRNA(Gln) amidotransferase subunit A